jgi:asparagine synthetase B (glutamine-hydrolysing)
LPRIVHQKLTINRSQLPHHFLHWRTIWGETLFKDIRRMLLGEQICLEAGKVSQMQMLRFSNMKIPLMKDSVEHLERVMANIIKEYATTYPNIVNIFSGGVDSSYVQAYLSQYLGSRVRTFSLALLHPSKIWALERQNVRYGISFFKTDHTFVKVIPSEYPTLLINTISDLGLPIRNPQTALLSKLFSSVTKTSSTALCGMCADVLFGLDLYQDIDIAYFIEKIMPFKNLREILLKIGKSLHKKTDVGALERFTKILQLELHDRSSPRHPFNVRDEARFKAAVELFGSREVSKTIFERQALMKRYQIEGSLKECFRSSLVSHCTQGAVESFYELASNVGLNILFPYLDSRMIKNALSMREPSRFPPSPMKKVIKDALRNHLPSMPRKSGWGLPIFEWMAPRGILYPLIKELEDSSFARYVGDAEKKSDSIIWNLLNFNVWHKRFFGHPA